MEPPGLFRGRGDHPKMGQYKRRIYPRDITINIGARTLDVLMLVSQYPCRLQSWELLWHTKLLSQLPHSAVLPSLMTTAYSMTARSRPAKAETSAVLEVGANMIV